MTRDAVRGDARAARRHFVGSPQEVVEKILFQHELFGHQRFLVQLSVGTLPTTTGSMRAIELFGTEVAPAVRSELAPRAKPERTKVSDGVARITTT